MKNLIITFVVLFFIGCNKESKKEEVILKRPILKILTWDGYADYKYVKEFEKKFNVEVKVDLVQNDDELWEKINNPSNQYDLFAANTAEISRYVKANLLSKLDLNKIQNLKNQKERFKDYKKIFEANSENEVFAIPYAFSEMGLIYNKNIVKTPPASMKSMWDSKYKGKVLVFDTYQHNFSIVALFKNMSDPFNLSDENLKSISNDLHKLKKNSLSFYTTIEESVKIFKENDVALIYGNFGKQQVDELRNNGANIEYIIPKEGALAWLDCWGITSYSKNQDLAHEWINYSLDSNVSIGLTTNHSLGNTISNSVFFNNKEKIIWLKPVSNPVLRKKLWDNILKD